MQTSNLKLNINLKIEQTHKIFNSTHQIIYTPKGQILSYIYDLIYRCRYIKINGRYLNKFFKLFFINI